MKKLLLLTLMLVMLCVAACAEESSPSPTPVTYRGYVYVQYGGRFAWYGLAQTPEDSHPITITQMTMTGEECVNVLMVTDQGVYMESANCSNQDCVGMGEVNLDNKDLTFGMIVCLPHEVYIQLYTPEEFQAWYEDYLNAMAQ